MGMVEDDFMFIIWEMCLSAVNKSLRLIVVVFKIISSV
jgi:hypothetical protein